MTLTQLDLTQNGIIEAEGAAQLTRVLEVNTTLITHVKVGYGSLIPLSPTLVTLWTNIGL